MCGGYPVNLQDSNQIFLSSKNISDGRVLAEEEDQEW
jgi:hypothetical protein